MQDMHEEMTRIVRKFRHDWQQPFIELLGEACEALLKHARCGHQMECSDPRCRKAGHGPDHEITSDGAGWCCGHDGCSCLPSCAGNDGDVCDTMLKIQGLITRIEETTARHKEEA